MGLSRVPTDASKFYVGLVEDAIFDVRIPINELVFQDLVPHRFATEIAPVEFMFQLLLEFPEASRCQDNRPEQLF